MLSIFAMSSPEGDIILTEDELATPFLLAPDKEHPFLTLKHYFTAIETFVLHENRASVAALLDGDSGSADLFEHADIVIRSEKHGSFYHVASVAITTAAKSRKLAVITAVSEQGKEYLVREFALIQQLGKKTQKSYLPALYFQGVHVQKTPQGNEGFRFFVGEWLEDYHEWHLSHNKENAEIAALIWDQNRGPCWASASVFAEIFSQASKILTLFYNPASFEQVHPWHHAAGDFIVRTVNNRVDVKLITVRDYQPLLAEQAGATGNPHLVAFLYFFLNLTVKMRLDRIDGVGQIVWAPRAALLATVTGFMEGFQHKQQRGEFPESTAEHFVPLLQSFSEKELFNLFLPLMKVYEHENPDDFPVIEANLAGHVQELVQTISAMQT